MPDKFHQSIDISLANLSLQAALDGNTERRLSVRASAFASLDDPEGMRQRARAVRADVIANLETYLAKFADRAHENGIIVHRAVDAQQALEVVLQIAQGHAAKLIAKSKTMVSEEIGLNHALERAGLRVVETDLGEFIIQLRGETPAHIITPAVHLRRGEVGQTFHEKLGIPLTEDIPTLTQAARQTLRQVFLSADIGLSGVNFGVAETGTLCVLTNEGNGRMVTSIPKVHIALMGIERLVPTMDDLALMLSLLPRSATGQKITVYASLINAPRRDGDPDGPLERHLILVDNGRSRIRGSPLEEILYCIRCGACLNACPVFREIGGHAYVGRDGKISPYSGPVGSVLSAGLFGFAEFGQLARASSLCGACREACPVDIDLPGLLLRVRAGKLNPPGSAAKPLPSAPVVQTRPNAPINLAIALRLYTWAAVSPRRFRMVQRLGGFFGWIYGSLTGGEDDLGTRWMRLPAWTGWGRGKDLPSPAMRPFRDQFLREKVSLGAVESVENKKRKTSIESETPDSIRNNSTAKTITTNKETLVAQFAGELTALGGVFLRCREADAGKLILDLLAERGITALLAWDEFYLPSGLLTEIKTTGVNIYRTLDEVKDQSVAIPRGGLTSALAGSADTGTLLLPGGAGRPLTASLLPELHIAILHEGDIYPDVQTIMNMQEVKDVSALALITGPSRTADIEMTLTIGVHGPGEVIVLCVP